MKNLRTSAGILLISITDVLMQILAQMIAWKSSSKENFRKQFCLPLRWKGKRKLSSWARTHNSKQIVLTLKSKMRASWFYYSFFFLTKENLKLWHYQYHHSTGFLLNIIWANIFYPSKMGTHFILLLHKVKMKMNFEY